MRRSIHQILIITLILIFICSSLGCGRRGRRGHAHDRDRDRTEYRESRDEDDDRPDRSESSRGAGWSKEEIERLAQGNDYDRMIDCLQAQLSELRSLRKRYFAGNMTDKEVQTASDEISSKYAPVYNRLDKASQSGELTYAQHKRQMRLAGDAMKEMNKTMNRLGSDLEHAMR